MRLILEFIENGADVVRQQLEEEAVDYVLLLHSDICDLTGTLL